MDAAGEKISESDYRGFLTQYAYDENGNQVGKKDALGHVLRGYFRQQREYYEPRRAAFSGFPSWTRRAVPYTGWARRSTACSPSINMTKRVARRKCGSGRSRFVFDVVAYDERNFRPRTFKMETLPDTPWDPALIGRLTTTCSYDVWGNKVSETDVSHNTQTWEYNVNPAAGDFTFGRLSRTNRPRITTDYKYNDFGSCGWKPMPVREFHGSGDKTDRVYTYHNNGMLKSLTDESCSARLGPVGMTTTAAKQYDQLRIHGARQVARRFSARAWPETPSCVQRSDRTFDIVLSMRRRRHESGGPSHPTTYVRARRVATWWSGR